MVHVLDVLHVRHMSEMGQVRFVRRVTRHRQRNGGKKPAAFQRFQENRSCVSHG